MNFEIIKNENQKLLFFIFLTIFLKGGILNFGMSWTLTWGKSESWILWRDWGKLF